jgi:biotin-(acetyl-CoA carboxylase) ligase
LQTVPEKLSAISEEAASQKPNPKKWSKKEILGHLIDSASNNHQRFVRLQIDNDIEFPKYKQDEWVAVQQWQQKNWKDIIALWNLYNEHIMHTLKYIDKSKLFNTITLGEEIYTLQFLIDDYVDHMEHHLQQISAE